MRRLLCSAVAAIALADGARAATLEVDSDKPTYQVGDTIVLTVTGDSEGAQAAAIFGQLDYPAALTQTVASSQTPHTSNGGAVSWRTYPLSRGDGFAWAFYQDNYPDTLAVDQLQIATVTLIAEAAGVVDVTWSTSIYYSLNFFGIANFPGAESGSYPGTSFEIVPEPTAAALLGLGLLAFAWHRRQD